MQNGWLIKKDKEKKLLIEAGLWEIDMELGNVSPRDNTFYEKIAW
jgi:hypothetical protein